MKKILVVVMCMVCTLMSLAQTKQENYKIDLLASLESLAKAKNNHEYIVLVKNMIENREIASLRILRKSQVKEADNYISYKITFEDEDNQIENIVIIRMIEGNKRVQSFFNYCKKTHFTKVYFNQKFFHIDDGTKVKQILKYIKA